MKKELKNSSLSNADRGNGNVIKNQNPYICFFLQKNMMRFLYKTFFLLLFCLCFSTEIIAQWNHFVTNFKKELYGRGAQTWQIKTYSDSYIYFANKKGLLEYNGCDWKLLPLNKQTDVRSIYISKRLNRIYVGGESEFGFFEPDESGSLVYTNLSEEFIHEHALGGSYWGIYEVDNITYFISDKHIVKQLNDDLSLIPSEYKIDCSTVINNVLYLGTFDGIKMLVGNTILPHPESDLLKGKPIRSIIPYEDGFLIGTAFDGLFIGKESKIYPLITGHEDFLNRNELFSLAASDQYLAIGTIHKGLLLLDRKTYSPKYFNEENGLQNNTVLSLSFDLRGNIWLGLDNGIDYIGLNSALTNLYTYPNSRGTGYVSLIKDDRLFLGTNRGLYYTQWPVVFTEKTIQTGFIPELSGQVWGLEDYEGELFCLHDKGLFLLKGNIVEQIHGIRGALTLIPHQTDPNKFWISTYTSFYLLQKTAGKWMVVRQIPDISNWPKNAVFESPEILWVRRLNEGVQRFVMDTADYSIKESRLYTEKEGLTSTVNLYIHKIKDKIYFSSDSGFFAYDRQQDKIIPANALNDAFSKRATPVLKEYKNTIYALSLNTVKIAQINPSGLLSASRVFSLPLSKVDFIRYYETIDIVNDSLLILPNEHGFSLLNTAHRSNKESKTNLFIKRVYATYPKDSLLFENNFLNLHVAPSVQYRNNALKIEYDVRSFALDKAVKFRYRLLPDDLWSDLTTATVKEYNNLKEGDYTFQVEAVTSDGQVAFSQFAFTILPPWYRTPFAWVMYALLFILLIRFLYLFEEKRLSRKKKKELAEKEKQMLLREQEYQKENLRKEQKIIELKNENLEQELKHKTQEMANLMINLSRKNEILMDIKNELHKVLNEMKGETFVKPKRMIILLTNQIDLDIQSDDILKRFEEQFDLIHNKFTTKLRDKHPDLTVGEIKMCTYLKMNLSSKEIAPLLHLSVRGVETLRYRLRKKMGLTREENLMEYLNNINI